MGDILHIPLAITQRHSAPFSILCAPSDPREQPVLPEPSAAPVPSPRATARASVRAYRDKRLREAAPELFRLVRYFVHAAKRDGYDPPDLDNGSLVEHAERLLVSLGVGDPA